MRGLIGQANLATRIESARTDVFSKYPDAGKVRMEAYFGYVICTQVLSDARLSPQEKAQLAVKLLPQDPAMAQLRQDAMTAVAAGDYDRAETLIAAARNQVTAVLLIDDGHPDLAIDSLQQSEQLLSGLHGENAAEDRLQRGYNYKTYAQAFAAKGDTVNERRYLDLAIETFKQVKDDPNLNGKTTAEFASAINGIGDIHYQQGLVREAIADFTLATDLEPDYAYAWHDMLLAYFELARQGDVDLPAVQRAFAKTKEGEGLPGLDAASIAQLQSILEKIEASKQ